MLSNYFLNNSTYVRLKHDFSIISYGISVCFRHSGTFFLHDFLCYPRPFIMRVQIYKHKFYMQYSPRLELKGRFQFHYLSYSPHSAGHNSQQRLFCSIRKMFECYNNTLEWISTRFIYEAWLSVLESGFFLAKAAVWTIKIEVLNIQKPCNYVCWSRKKVNSNHNPKLVKLQILLFHCFLFKIESHFNKR